MSALEVSKKLGDYMLKGWVLTDVVCPNDGCNAIPLMRSPINRVPVVYHCVHCDSDPLAPQPTSSASARDASPSTAHSANTRNSETSTPPTDVSSVLSSPTFAPAYDTEEALRRREQSDLASAEIGRRLLKGWAMLADECPNDGCIGIPLVRPPRTAAGKSSRKECVVCGNVYIDEKDAEGLNAANAQSEQQSQAVSNSEEPAQRQVTSNALQLSNAPSANGLVVSTINAATNALDLSLKALSNRLTSLAANELTADPILISQTVDAMGKILQVWEQTENLRSKGMLG